MLDEIRLMKGDKIGVIVATVRDDEPKSIFILWFTSIEEVPLTDEGAMISLKNKDDNEATAYKLGEKLTELRLGMGK